MQSPLDPLATPDRGTVLVVDDAPETLRLLCDTLEASGYTVLVARDGETAIKRLGFVLPDAILLDGVMPGVSGFETCQRIKAEPAWAHIPVIFMTGLAETEHIVAGFDCGGVDYVVKPVREAEILARLHTHTRNARMSRLGMDRESRNERVTDAKLTPRETEVLSWLAKGKTNRDISEILSMSPRTVNKHLEHVFEKLGVETRSAAAALASSVMA